MKNYFTSQKIQEVSIQPKPDTGLIEEFGEGCIVSISSFNPAEARYGFNSDNYIQEYFNSIGFNPAEARYGFNREKIGFSTDYRKGFNPAEARYGFNSKQKKAKLFFNH